MKFYVLSGRRKKKGGMGTFDQNLEGRLFLWLDVRGDNVNIFQIKIFIDYLFAK